MLSTAFICFGISLFIGLIVSDKPAVAVSKKGRHPPIEHALEPEGHSEEG